MLYKELITSAWVYGLSSGSPGPEILLCNLLVKKEATVVSLAH